jgi:DnaJ homolog subfamily A member 5
MTTAEDVLKVIGKYNGRLDYTNSNTGFYGGLREFFRQLAKEEEIACKWENMEPVEYPDFGQRDDEYEDVVRPFYSAWNGFFTRKSYSWKDHYRPSDAPDRRVRRLLEKENKGLRDDAIREFNDAVRSLIAFVRKRDPRYQENQKSEKERQKILRDAAAAQSARSRAARQAKLDEVDRQNLADWANPTVADDNEGDFSSEEESEQHEIECVVCSKTFKSEAQYEAHEKSKKHLKLLKKVQREMRDQDQEIEDGGGQVPGPSDRHQQISTSDGEEVVVANSDPPLQNGDDTPDHEKPDTVKSEKPGDGEEAIASDASLSVEQSSPGGDDDYAPRSRVESRLADPSSDDLSSQLKATVLGDNTGASDAKAFSVPKLGKAKQKRAKKAAQKDAGSGNPNGSNFRCAVCRADFTSNTKLFNHIKEKGHAAPVAVTGSKNANSSKGRKS